MRAIKLNNLIYEIIKKASNLSISTRQNQNNMLTWTIQKTIILRGVLRLTILIEKILSIPKKKFVDPAIILSSFTQ